MKVVITLSKEINKFNVLFISDNGEQNYPDLSYPEAILLVEELLAKNRL